MNEFFNLNELHAFLKDINLTVWFFDAISLYMFSYICWSTKKVNSSFISMIVIFVISWTMMGYQGLLESYMLKYPGYNPVVNFCWYMGFTTLNILSLIILRKAHEFAEVKFGSLAHYLSWVLFILSCLQLAKYAEIILTHSEKHLFMVYVIGIPTINIASTIVCFCLALIGAYHVLNNKDNIEGIKKWTL